MNYKTSLYPGVPSYVLQEGLGSGARVTQWLPRGHFDLPGQINLGDTAGRAKTIRGGMPLAGFLDQIIAGKKPKMTPSQYRSRVKAIASRTRTRNPRYAAAIASGNPSVRNAHAAAAESAAKNIYNIAINMPAETRKEFLQETLNNVAPGLYGVVASRASVIEARGNNANDATIAAISDSLSDFANDGKIQDDSMSEAGMEKEEWMGEQQLDGLGNIFGDIGRGIKKGAKAVAGGVKSAAKKVASVTRKIICKAGKVAASASVEPATAAGGAAAAGVMCKDSDSATPGEQVVYQEQVSAGGGPAGGMSTSTKLLIGGAAVGGVLLLVMATRGRK